MGYVLAFTAAQFTALSSHAAGTNGLAPTVHPLTAPGLHNYFHLSDRVFSGSAPEGDAGFAALKAKGIKTIISVDGSKPDVREAAKFGLRYVHIPIGYDGVPTNQAYRLVKAVEVLPGPFYVHCHHGLHRGPAGAAVICMGVEGWSAQNADSWLRVAGTATNYAGLYRTVDDFRPPSADVLKQLPNNFPSQAEISALGEVMVEIDERADHLKLIKKAGFKQPAENPDLDPAHEALLLNELIRELLRSPAVEKRSADFMDHLKRMEQLTGELHAVLDAKPVVLQKADDAYQHMVDACAACHKAYRN